MKNFLVFLSFFMFLGVLNAQSLNDTISKNATYVSFGDDVIIIQFTDDSAYLDDEAINKGYLINNLYDDDENLAFIEIKLMAHETVRPGPVIGRGEPIYYPDPYNKLVEKESLVKKVGYDEDKQAYFVVQNSQESNKMGSFFKAMQETQKYRPFWH